MPAEAARTVSDKCTIDETHTMHSLLTALLSGNITSRVLEKLADEVGLDNASVQLLQPLACGALMKLGMPPGAVSTVSSKCTIDKTHAVRSLVTALLAGSITPQMLEKFAEEVDLENVYAHVFKPLAFGALVKLNMVPEVAMTISSKCTVDKAHAVRNSVTAVLAAGVTMDVLGKFMEEVGVDDAHAQIFQPLMFGALMKLDMPPEAASTVSRKCTVYNAHAVRRLVTVTRWQTSSQVVSLRRCWKSSLRKWASMMLTRRYSSRSRLECWLSLACRQQLPRLVQAIVQSIKRMPRVA